MATTNPIVTGLTSYVEEHKSELLTKTLLDGKSRGMFNLMTNVLGPTKIHLMDVDVHFQPLACGWNESGSTEYTDRVLTPAALQVEMAYCDKNLIRTYLQTEINIAAGRESIPFEEKWTSQIVGSINEQIEKMIYQGQSGQTNQFEGLISILEGDAMTVTGTTASGATAYELIKDAAAAIPANVKNPVILVSTPVYREWMQNLVSANLYHYNPENGANEYLLPGTDIKVIAVDGLNGTAGYDYAIAANVNNIVYGCDLEGDDSEFRLWFSEDNSEFRIRINFVGGVQVGYPEEIVLWKRAK